MATAKTTKPKGQNGGARRGAGRPKGSKNIHSQESVKKLEELNFDPIAELVKQVQDIDNMMEQTYIDKNGEEQPSVRVGSGAHAQLVATRGTLINHLMQYGYRKVPEKVQTEDLTKKPMEISFNFGEPTKET